MGGLEQFFIKNIDTIIVLAFILLPIILNARKLKKKAQDKAGGPARHPPTAAQKKKRADSLESKVRQFFEELTEQQQPKKPVLEPEPEPPQPVTLEVPSPEPIPEEGFLPPPPPAKVEEVPQQEEEEVIRKLSARELKKLDKSISGIALSRSTSLKPKGKVRIGALKNYSRAELQKAIVMVEVLGKPVALKR